MVKMELEELVYQHSVCGIWTDSVEDLSIDKILTIIEKAPPIRYIAYCMTGRDVFPLAQWLKEFRDRCPALRIVAISNPRWYHAESLRIQNEALQWIEQADLSVPCSFPKEDALNFMLLCSQVLLIHPDHRTKAISLKKSLNKVAVHIIYI